MILRTTRSGFESPFGQKPNPIPFPEPGRGTTFLPPLPVSGRGRGLGLRQRNDPAHHSLWIRDPPSVRNLTPDPFPEPGRGTTFLPPLPVSGRGRGLGLRAQHFARGGAGIFAVLVDHHAVDHGVDDARGG